MNKKLLIIVGAGASIDFGMPSVKTIDNLFETWGKEILPLKTDNTQSLYTWVKERLTKYAQQNPRNRIDNIVNFESLLFTIQNIATVINDDHWQHFNNRLKPFIQVDTMPEVERFGKIKVADGNDFHFLHSYLIDKLLENFREKCKTVNNDKAIEIKKLSDFFTKLKTEFDLGFVNLNYDNVVLSCLPDLETGFDAKTGEFRRDKLYSGKWNFCYHMHGSVHFDLRGNKTEMHKIYWNSDLTTRFAQNSSGRSSNYTSEGLSHLNSAIIAGLDKSNQLLKEPFGPYFMQLDKVIHESDAILFLGYGFNDTHLNRIFPFVRNDSKKRKVVIVDWANTDEDGLNFRHDGWSFGVFSTVPFNGFEMGDGKSRLPNPANHYKSNKILEKSSNPDYPLAVWYDGLLEACEYSDKIIDELR